jgi:ubiquinone/menaquinone biosynthesis C-methylase UbiE
MSATDKVFAGSIPQLYDTLVVPLIFEVYARDVAERVAAVAPRATLEVAAGTGVLTRNLAARLPAGARIVATDLNQTMLDQAARRQPADGRITWQQADGLALPFGDGGFDAVACQFGAMFFPDRVHGYREARRVLRPGGHYFVAVWHHIGANEFADVVTEAVGELFPQDPPRFLARTPHGYHDPKEIADDLARASFAKVTVETVARESRAPSARDVAVAYCQGTPLRNEIEARDAAGLEAATAAAEAALARRFGTGPIVGGISALVAVATG